MPNSSSKKILIWLPSPLGDAILSTPALSAFRTHYADSRITFLASPTVQAFLSPCPFCNEWIKKENSFWKQYQQLRREKFDTAILLKNSFGSAFAVFLAGVGQRIGYARDARSLFLTDKLVPEKQGLQFKPVSVMDYYLNIARFVGANPQNRNLYIGLRQQDRDVLNAAFPELQNRQGPLVILVPGGAFGPSKLWSALRFARLSDELVERYKAAVIISVAPTTQEKKIAGEIRSATRHPPLSLSDRPLNAGTLKALFEKADLVITNDTGPRHIAAALGRKIITLFGPNNPAWTETSYKHEIRIAGQAPCAPCDKPKCIQDEHYCMNSISVEQVFEAAQKILETTSDE